MTRKCPTCGGDGIVYSEASAAIDVERRLRSLVAGSRSQAYRVELAAPIAAALIGPGAARLQELEAMTKRRFYLEGKPDTHSDHFVVLAEGKLGDVAPESALEEGVELQVELLEIDRHDAKSAVGKVDGVEVCVAGAAEFVGKRVKVRIERVLDNAAYATLVRKTKQQAEPLTAEAEAEKPTRKPPVRKSADGATVEDGDEDADEPLAAEAETLEAGDADVEDDVNADAEPVVADAEATTDDDTDETDADAVAPEAGAPAKKKTRRGSRGGKNRKKPAAAGSEGEAATGETDDAELEADVDVDAQADADDPAPAPAPARPRSVRIHVPGDDLGREDDDEDEAAPEGGEPAAGGNGAAPAKRKTRRGSRGGKNRRKRTAAAGAATNGSEAADATDETEAEAPLMLEAGPQHEELEPPVAQAAPEPAEPVADPELAPAAEEPRKPSQNGSEDEWGYVPMSEWGDEFSR